MDGDRELNRSGDAVPRRAHSDIVFKARSIDPSPTGRGYIGVFTFRNNTRGSISLPGLEAPGAGIYSLSHVEFEVRENAKWITMNIAYDGIAPEFTVAPKSECLLAIDLIGFREQNDAVVGRVRVSGYTSESFLLDWPSDKANGRFRQAKQEHVRKIRRLLREAGFRESATAGEDFYSTLLSKILRTTESDDLGFARFQGELNTVPIEISGGNLRFDFSGSVMVNSDYQYSGMLVLNPSTFTPAWYRISAPSFASVSTWGTARILKIDDGSGFYTEANKLYLEIKYRAAPDEKLPDEDRSTELLSRMLHAFDDCLKPSSN